VRHADAVAGSRSAGLLLYRWVDGGVQVLLAHMGGPYWSGKDERAWSIPKGEYGTDEEPVSAARREFAEELGAMPPRDVAYLELGQVRQAGGKTVTVWACEGGFDPAEARSNTVEIEWPPRSGQMRTFPEVDRVAWFGLDEAARKLVTAQAQFLDRLRDALG
jgi:predicted NUDIX family NTP pyrophosphohydrolase